MVYLSCSSCLNSSAIRIKSIDRGDDVPAEIPRPSVSVVASP